MYNDDINDCVYIVIHQFTYNQIESNIIKNDYRMKED